ncbi:hypothetical protein INR49_026107 [Caranx melampygus]|nr:hypothetical protein INR49_026107 [Caranx melampygus]
MTALRTPEPEGTSCHLKTTSDPSHPVSISQRQRIGCWVLTAPQVVSLLLEHAAHVLFSVVSWRQSSHTTDGTPTTQPAGWSCLTVKTLPASYSVRPMALSQRGELMQNAVVFPFLANGIYRLRAGGDTGGGGRVGRAKAEAKAGFDGRTGDTATASRRFHRLAHFCRI